MNQISMLKYVDYYDQEPMPAPLQQGQVVVDLTNEFDKQLWKEIPRSLNDNFRMFQMKYKGEYMTYVILTKTSKTLWTLNDNGQPKAASVFSIKE